MYKYVVGSFAYSRRNVSLSLNQKELINAAI